MLFCTPSVRYAGASAFHELLLMMKFKYRTQETESSMKTIHIYLCSAFVFANTFALDLEESAPVVWSCSTGAQIIEEMAKRSLNLS